MSDRHENGLLSTFAELTQVTLLGEIFAIFDGEIARKSNRDGAGVSETRCSEDLPS